MIGRPKFHAFKYESYLKSLKPRSAKDVPAKRLFGHFPEMYSSIKI